MRIIPHRHIPHTSSAASSLNSANPSAQENAPAEPLHHTPVTPNVLWNLTVSFKRRKKPRQLCKLRCRLLPHLGTTRLGTQYIFATTCKFALNRFGLGAFPPGWRFSDSFILPHLLSSNKDIQGQGFSIPGLQVELALTIT